MARAHERSEFRKVCYTLLDFAARGLIFFQKYIYGLLNLDIFRHGSKYRTPSFDG